MALANLRHGKVRRALHLFDSFEGVPEPDEKVDGSRAVGAVRAAGGGTSGRLVPVAMSAAPLGDCRTLLEDEIGYPAADLHYHVGWFQETLPHAAGDVGEIAILRLDADWHASTLVCLEHLFPRVVAGGFIVIDDYGEYEGCRNAVDAYLRDAGIRPYLHHVDSTGRYFIKA